MHRVRISQGDSWKKQDSQNKLSKALLASFDDKARAGGGTGVGGKAKEGTASALRSEAEVRTRRMEEGSGSHLREAAFRSVNQILSGRFAEAQCHVDLGLPQLALAVRFQIDCREGNAGAENTNDSKTQIWRNINLIVNKPLSFIRLANRFFFYGK